MSYSAENPRYIAYTTNAFGTVESGRTNRKAEAWRLADAATKEAELSRAGINHTAAIFDRGAGTSGSMVYRTSASRGGARPGAGRKAKDPAGAGETFTFRLAGEARARIEAQPEGQRSEFLRLAILAYQLPA